MTPEQLLQIFPLAHDERGDAGHLALRRKAGTAVSFSDLAQALNPVEITLQFLPRPLLALRAPFQFHRAEKERGGEPVRAIEPGVLEEQQIVDLPFARLLAEDFSPERNSKRRFTQAGIAGVLAVSDAVHPHEPFVQRHLAVTQPLEMERLLPRLAAAGRSIDATEGLARSDVTGEAVFPRRARPVADPGGRADGQGIVPVKATLRLFRESVVDVRAVRREGEGPARIEFLFGSGHVEAGHLAGRKIAGVNQDGGLALHAPHVVGDLPHEGKLAIEEFLPALGAMAYGVVG